MTSYDKQIQQIESTAEQQTAAIKAKAKEDVALLLQAVLFEALPVAPAEGLKVDEITSIAAKKGLTEKAGYYRQILADMVTEGRAEKLERPSASGRGKPAHLFRRLPQ